MLVCSGSLCCRGSDGSFVWFIHGYLVVLETGPRPMGLGMVRKVLGVYLLIGP